MLGLKRKNNVLKSKASKKSTQLPQTKITNYGFDKTIEKIDKAIELLDKRKN